MSQPLLEADKLGVHFGGVVAVADVSLAIAGNGITCIIGPNGAGKSTLFNMLTGTVRPSSGRVRVGGEDLTGSRIERFARSGIARKFQTPSVFDRLTVEENVEIARHPSGAAKRQTVGSILAFLGLAGAAGMPAGALAHGQKQWLEIGMALATEPKLMLLDEPTAGMGPEETEKTAKLVTDLSGEMAIAVIEHDMAFIRALASRTLVMHQGKVVADGAFAEIEDDPLVRDIYLGRR
jgi:branched-chain amino acid transport system ATP-binding protein/urea transport system ATP-binding protein